MSGTISLNAGVGSRSGSGTLTGLGDAGVACQVRGAVGVFLAGTLVGTVIVERRAAGTVDWFPVPTDALGTPATYTMNGTSRLSIDGVEDVPGIEWRVRISGFTSGQLSWRMEWRA